MFETICDMIPRDSGFPPRVRALDILRRVLDGTFYDVLPYQFHDERTASGEYIPLRRAPSLRPLRTCTRGRREQRLAPVQRGAFPGESIVPTGW